MDIHAGDYVTLKSIEEVKPFYKFWDMANDGNVTTDTDYFSTNMLDAKCGALTKCVLKTYID